MVRDADGHEIPDDARASQREACLREAERVVMGPRANQYGPPVLNFTRIARIWSVILDMNVTPAQVALCMDGVKTARLIQDPTHFDSWVDKAGYAACGAEVSA